MWVVSSGGRGVAVMFIAIFLGYFKGKAIKAFKGHKNMTGMVMRAYFILCFLSTNQQNLTHLSTYTTQKFCLKSILRAPVFPLNWQS
jgi:hypothetical protein